MFITRFSFDVGVKFVKPGNCLISEFLSVVNSGDIKYKTPSQIFFFEKKIFLFVTIDTV